MEECGQGNSPELGAATVSGDQTEEEREEGRWGWSCRSSSVTEVVAGEVVQEEQGSPETPEKQLPLLTERRMKGEGGWGDGVGPVDLVDRSTGPVDQVNQSDFLVFYCFFILILLDFEV